MRSASQCLKKFSCVFSFFFVLVILLIIYLSKGYAPWGLESLAWNDANIQYLDLFAGLKNALEGGYSSWYSFAKGLGGNLFADFSYYLASPLNLLVVFFKKTELHSFLDILIALKLSLAAFTMSIFLCKRTHNKLRGSYNVMLSASYALSSYCIAQSSNVMWLDGVYTLPLMLWGVYQCIWDRNSFLLTFATALSIVFNWYTGAVNCLFTAIWGGLELYLYYDDYQASVKVCLVRFAHLALCGICGVLIGFVIICPTLSVLQDSTRGHINLRLLKLGFNGNPVTALTNNVIGAKSSREQVALFCGSFAWLGLLGYFAERGSSRQKTALAVMLIGVVLSFYWQWMFAIFSLMKDATSYWFRYAYIGVFTVIFISAQYYQLPEEERDFSKLLRVAGIWSLFLLLFNKEKTGHDLSLITMTASSCLFLVYAFILYRKLKRSCWASYVVMLLLCAVGVELGYNAEQLFKDYKSRGGEVLRFQHYQREEQALIDDLKKKDVGFYRISQTRGRFVHGNNLTAYYNDPLNFNYRSLSVYTSSPDDAQRHLLHKFGYRINGENMNIVNTCILPADSFLGVKYVLSHLRFNGLEQVSDIQARNDKVVYLNPNALPPAFLCGIEQVHSFVGRGFSGGNPFLYQNQVFKSLAKLNEDVFISLPVKTKKGKTRVNYELELPAGDYIYYGNIAWKTQNPSSIYVNGKFVTAYSRWTAPSVFHIPVGEGDRKTQIVLHMARDEMPAFVQFYALDIKALERLSKTIQAQKADHFAAEDGHVVAKVHGTKGQVLFTLIPYNKGWKITRNGAVIKPMLFEDCLIMVPLVEGENRIEMVFSLPGAKWGIIGSVIGIVMLICFCLLTRSGRSCR